MCQPIYTDYNIDVPGGELQAWGSVEDYFDSGTCFNDVYQYWYLWSHSYEARVEIVGPNQNSSDDVDTDGAVYGGGSAYAYTTTSFNGDFGLYDIDWIMDIICSVAGLILDFDEEEDDVRLYSCAVSEAGMTGMAITVMMPWDPKPYERGGSMYCYLDIALPLNLMDSFGDDFPPGVGGYSPTQDPCALELYTADIIGGFHSHPDFDDNDQLEEGVGCFGQSNWDLTGTEINALNSGNRNFSKAEWPDPPTDCCDWGWVDDHSVPLYLLVPDADQVKALWMDLDSDTVWPL